MLPLPKLAAAMISVLIVVSGCTDEAPAPSDAGALEDAMGPVRFDQGVRDLGAADAALSDMGSADAETVDLGTTDLGGVDLGVVDLGTVDLGTVDLGTPDLGTPDAGDQCAAPYPVVPSPPAPPYGGTLFIDPNILTDADPTAFVSLSYTGQGNRTMYDRRTASFNLVNAHLFDAQFGTTVQVEIQVNPEFNQAEAQIEASRYATVIGRLPAFFFRDLETVWIHRGLQPFGGGNQNLLIHTEQGEAYAADELLEEAFLHEASHTSMDAYHGAAARWQEAQAADGTFLSTYARDNPTREDVAETVGPYLALRFRSQRVDQAVLSAIAATVPNRIAYLDCLGLTMDLVP